MPGKPEQKVVSTKGDIMGKFLITIMSPLAQEEFHSIWRRNEKPYGLERKPVWETTNDKELICQRGKVQ